MSYIGEECSLDDAFEIMNSTYLDFGDSIALIEIAIDDLERMEVNKQTIAQLKIIIKKLEETKKKREIELKSGKLKIRTFSIISDRKILSHHRTRNFMRIRIIEPDKELWHSIRKRKGFYYVVKEGEKGSTKFIILDIGDLEEKGIQGIAFVRGVPKEYKKKINATIFPNDWKSQSIRAEYRLIKASYSDPPEKQIKAVLKKYKKDIINFLEREYGEPIKKISIIPKDDDFKLILSFK